jgi:hypothetical protein
VGEADEPTASALLRVDQEPVVVCLTPVMAIVNVPLGDRNKGPAHRRRRAGRRESSHRRPGSALMGRGREHPNRAGCSPSCRSQASGRSLPPRMVASRRSRSSRDSEHPERNLVRPSAASRPSILRHKPGSSQPPASADGDTSKQDQRTVRDRRLLTCWSGFGCQLDPVGRGVGGQLG